MSATLRYDLGLHAARQLGPLDSSEHPLAVFGMKQTQRYAGGGYYGPDHANYHQCVTFAIKLPVHVCDAWHTLETIAYHCRQPLHGLARLSLLSFREKLTWSLGLPTGYDPGSGAFLGDGDCASMERSFLDALGEHPEDLASWSAYSDWLQESGDTPAGTLRMVRGEIIALWLSSSAALVKYGKILRQPRQPRQPQSRRRGKP